MVSDSRGDITQLLAEVRLGTADATAALAERVFDNLRRIARGRLQHERPNHTLQPTALVSLIHLLASLSVAVFLYVFYKAQR
jgi:hypothetical protein